MCENEDKVLASKMKEIIAVVDTYYEEVSLDEKVNFIKELVEFQAKYGWAAEGKCNDCSSGCCGGKSCVEED